MRYFSLLILFVLFASMSHGQFYSGSYQEFGKNRVQYNQFQWKYQHFERFRVHFYPGEEELAEYCAKVFHREMLAIEAFFDFRIQDMLDLVVFTSKSKFNQSNIGITHENNESIGGLSKVVGAKLFVYYEGSHEELNRQIKEVLSEVMLRKMLFDGNWKDVIKANSFATFPEWYMNGFVSYMSRPWDPDLDAKLKDLLLMQQPLNFSRLEGNDATLIGHAIWHYVEWNFGRDIIPQILYLTRLTRNPNHSFRGVLGVDKSDLVGLMRDYFFSRYKTEIPQQEPVSKTKVAFTHKRGRSYHHFNISPDGQRIAYVENHLGRYWLKILDVSTQKTTVIYRAEPRLYRAPDYSFPAMAWHPLGKALVFSTERKGELRLHIYTPDDGKTSRRVVHNMDKILSMNYAPDGKKLVFSAVRNGRTNLIMYTIQGNAHTHITDDLWDDVDPIFTGDGKHILFASNRPSDSLTRHTPEVMPYQRDYDLFVLNVNQIDRHVVPLVRLDRSVLSNDRQPVELDNGRIAFLSDANGVSNRMLAVRDSVIHSIDTAIHYRQVVHFSPLTNWETQILAHQYNRLQHQFYSLVYQNGRYKLVQTLMQDGPTKPLVETDFVRFRSFSDPHKVYQSDEIELKDTLGALSHVTYKETRIDSLYLKRTVIIGDAGPLVQPTSMPHNEMNPLAYKRPREILYKPEFARDFLVTKLDNQFMSATYQRYTGPGTTFFNPGLNALMRVGYSDIHEDFKLVGGLRIPFDLRSGEQLIELHFLKKRVDHKLVLYRQSLRQNDALGDEVKWQIYEMKHGLSYPFSEVLSLRGTYGYRYDREVVLARSESSLVRPNSAFHQAAGKIELVLDNARMLQLNLWSGTKAKLFAEYMHQFAPNRHTINLGFDVRHYQRLVKHLVWVNRFSGATSLGNQRVVYYMGGVDNWLIRPNPHFDAGIDVDPNQPYAYQTLASPMRGFLQNSRNGNSFVAWNSEFRLPVVGFFSKKPVKSELLRSLQLVGFMDLGTAWTGPHPYSDENYFNKLIIPGNPISITLLNSREPFIMGFGAGIRAMLFGYFMKLDCGWGLDSGVVRSRPRLQFSLGWDI